MDFVPESGSMPYYIGLMAIKGQCLWCMAMELWLRVDTWFSEYNAGNKDHCRS